MQISFVDMMDKIVRCCANIVIKTMSLVHKMVNAIGIHIISNALAFVVFSPIRNLSV